MILVFFNNNKPWEKEIKDIHIKKEEEEEEVKLSPLAGDMILYIENPKDSTKKLRELVNEFSKFAGYEINTQKSVAFLYSNNKLLEREIKKIISFPIASK